MTGIGALLTGLALGLSLIVAIGAQNLYVLRQGLRREHVGLVVGVCAGSDVVLVSAGVVGTTGLLQTLPWLEDVTRVGGAGFLAVCAVLAARRVLRPGEVDLADGAAVATPVAVVLATSLALTWLNPHVYLDTVLVLGRTATSYGSGRWWFAAGAVLASALWFSLLGFGARLLRPVFSRGGSWRVLDGATAVVLAGLAVSLLMP